MASVLVVNAGSTSVKLRVVDESEETHEPASLADVSDDDLGAVAHRVVHGGPDLRVPVLIDEEIRRAIHELQGLAPLHNAPALRGIDEACMAFPTSPTWLFSTPDSTPRFRRRPPSTQSPLRWREEWGIRRYGFHGLSVEWSTERTAQLLGRARDATRGLPPRRRLLGHGGRERALR